MNYYIVFPFIILLAVAILILIFGRVIEPFYSIIFNKPIFVHFYPFPKKLTVSQAKILKDQFQFYRRLNKKQQCYFEHRVAKFIERYTFYGKEGLRVTEQMKVLIAATAVMLTFGMRKYLFEVIDKIIIYPDIYYSSFTKENHKGEFNPRMKAIVFSWKHFLEGYEISNDNLNLGLHEFAHVLHFQGLTSKDISSVLFVDTYEKIMKEIQNPKIVKQIVKSEYFRIYAFTNSFEFIAVILEHFFETPEQFRAEFPQLYKKVKIMINFDLLKL